LLVYFLWQKPSTVTGGAKRTGFDGCVDDVIKQEIESLGLSGGMIQPELTYMYNSENFVYLCYTNLYHTACVNQKPFLKQAFEESLLRVSKEKITNCYKNSMSELQSKGYDISSSEPNINISLVPSEVIVSINAGTTVSRTSENTQYLNDFTVKTNSPIYNMLIVSTSIIQYETNLGDTDTSALAVYYPDFSFNKVKRSDGTKVYVVQDRSSKVKFQFATRSFALPAGYDVSS
ncbi:MAG: hypothetical protein WCP89_02845, partial [archaeon]